MRCPALSELPSPPPGKTGWPWTEESPQLPDLMSDGSSWPRISIVTPSYNQGQFIEETIRSVLLQGYPDLEYIIIDGRSTDNSVEIIKRYEPWLTYWVSEKDQGQSHAINKGMEHCTGEVAAWLNSDDLYLPEALAHIANAWEIGRTHWLVGKVMVGESLPSRKTRTVSHSRAPSFLEIAAYWLARERNLQSIPQPAAFVSRQAWRQVGGVFEKLYLTMDYHLWAKLAVIGYVPRHVPKEIALFRLHANQKTATPTEDRSVRIMGERAWSLYDALRLAREVKSPSPDIEEAARLFENKAAGFSRVLDAIFTDRSWFKLFVMLLFNALFRPNTILRWTPRAIMKYYIHAEFRRALKDNPSWTNFILRLFNRRSEIPLNG